MACNVLRDFRSHAKRAEIQFNGKFTIHTFRKTCAQNWADCLPANVVKFYLGHSTLETTNKFYSIVDETHNERTKKAMDEMLKKSQTENHLDTGWTLAQKKGPKKDFYTKEMKNKINTSPYFITTSESSQKSGW